MSLEAETRFMNIIKNPSVKHLDSLITLNMISCISHDLDKIWEKAVKIGQSWRLKYWNEALKSKDNLLALGLTRLRTMSPVEEMVWRARAFYDPNTFEIVVSESRIDELLEALEDCSIRITKEDIWQMIIEHEVFHHIEETKEQPLDIILAEDTVSLPPAAIRDIGAFAFANCAPGRPPCQLLDLVWMKKYAPKRLEQILENHGIGFE